MARTKKINKQSDEEVIIDDVSKNGLTKEKLFEKKDIVIIGKSRKSSYLIFGIYDTAEKYDIKPDWVIMLLYLHELELFNLEIRVLGKLHRIGEYKNHGLIKPNYSNNGKRLYCLSQKGLKVIEYLYSCLDDNSKYILKNRQTDVDLDSKVKGVLSNYFND